MRTPLRLAAPLLLLALPACTGASDNLIGTAFPTARMGAEARLAGIDGESFTVRRILGRPDGLQPLREDTTLTERDPDGRSLRELLDVEGTRPNIFDQVERGAERPAEPQPPRPRARGSSSLPSTEERPEVEPRIVTAPRPPAAAPPSAALAPGTVVPGPQGGTVAGGSAGSVTTTVGPQGQPGTATRDGRTITLFGADGSIRTVPAPVR